MKIKQTILFLAIGMVLLPLAFLLLVMQGGVLSSILSIIFFISGIVFLSVSTRRIFTKDLLRLPWFWATLFGAVLVLIGIILIYF